MRRKQWPDASGAVEEVDSEEVSVALIVHHGPRGVGIVRELEEVRARQGGRAADRGYELAGCDGVDTVLMGPRLSVTWR